VTARPTGPGRPAITTRGSVDACLTLPGRAVPIRTGTGIRPSGPVAGTRRPPTPARRDGGAARVGLGGAS